MQTKRKANRRRSSFLSRRGRLVSQPLDRRLRLEPLEDRRMLATLIVNSVQDSVTSGDGLVTLREAIVAANNDTITDLGLAGFGVDTIRFATNVFDTPKTIFLGLGEIEITEEVTIEGPGQQLLKIDAQQNSRIFNITAATGDFTLAGLSLTGGRTTANGTLFRGGAIRSSSTGSLTIDQSTVTGNSTTGNSAGGGGIYANGDVTLTHSTVSGNSTADNGSIGGGIFSLGDGGVTLTHSTVSGNSTAGDLAGGGGIFSNSGPVTLTDSTVSGNSTTGFDSAGGGIRSYFGTVTLTRSTVSGNSTAGGGSNGSSGGGIFTYGSVTLTLSTVSGNSTVGGITAGSKGGGIFAGQDIILTQSTVTSNHINNVLGYGGGISAGASIVITNSIVAGNTAGGGMNDIRPGSGSLNVNFSLIQQTGLPLVGSGNITGVLANLESLASNGGPTQTHALLSTSPAIDAGDPSIIPNPAEFDQRGAQFVRVFDDPAAAGTSIDMGAYERQTLPGINLVVDTPIDENDSDYSAGDLSLREAVDLARGSVGADTITFDATVFATPQTILLSLGEIEISEAVTIDATPLPSNVIIDAQQDSRIFNITATTGDFTLAGLTLTGGRTTANGTLFKGGAIRSSSTGSLTIDQSTVTGNSTTGNQAGGGGISSNGPVMLTGSTVSENSTVGSGADGGGIFSLGSGGVTLTNSTLSGNSTVAFAADGGGIFSNSGPVTLTHSTVSGNSTAGGSAYGGGISSGGPVTLTYSTVTANHADHATATGGGIWNSNDPLVITNSIVAGNTAGGGMNNIRPGTGSLDVNFSLIEQIGLTLVGSGNILGLPANLGPLADNGGPTKTHGLLAGSPAIDAGDPSIVPNPAEFDQRGAPFVRVFDDPSAVGTGIDMGAYERQTLPGLNLVVDTPVDENDGDYNTGDLSLREAVELANGSVGSDTITFDATVFATPQTISLGLGELEIGEAVTIDGPGQQLLTIDAQQNSRIFDITAATGDFTLAGLTLTGGRTLASDESGGAIRSITTGNLTLDRSTVSGNSTAGFVAYGGGIYSQGAVTFTDSTVSGNSTADTFARGGGIYSQGAVTLTDSTVSGNSTAGGGADGGGISSQGTVTLTSSTVSGNFTTADSADGGGIFSLVGAAVTLTDSTVSGNSTAGNSADGGGIYSKGAVTLMHSTITDNHANHTNAFGGGIWNDNDSIVIDHSIVAENTDGGGMDDIRPGTGTLTANFSLIGTGVTPGSGGNNVASNFPNLGPLANNGGPTKTRAPLSGSPALDAGDPAIVFNPADFDQRGAPFVRVFDDPGATGTGIDIGAYERQTLAGLNLVVDVLIDEDNGNTSVGNLSLREAVDLANGSVGANTIMFDPTVFATPQTILLGLGEIGISEAVAIDGPSGQLLTIDAQQQSRIFNITATTGDFTLAGLSMTGGRTTATGLLAAGGAIRSLTSGSLTIDQSTVSGNSTSGTAAFGGGIFSSGIILLTHSTINGNSSGSGGGGIFSYGAVTLTNSTVSGNSTTDSGASGGGILSVSIGGVTLTNSTLSGNSTVGDDANGGGIATGGPVTLTNSTVSGNSTAGSDADGGGINTAGNVTLNHSTVTANHADHATAVGGGIWDFNDPIVITNSIVAGNTAGGGMNDIRPGTGSLDVNFSLIEQTGLTLVGSGNILGLPANLGPLADNGGPTKTHGLLAGSPAIDAGDPSIIPNPAEFDQRGAPFVRVFDDPAAVGTGIDIGAYERQTVAGLNLVVDTPNDENDGDYTAGDLSLREAVGLASGSIGADTVNFDAALTGSTIFLILGQLTISSDITLAGLGADVLTIDAQNTSSVIRVFNSATVDISGLTLTGGHDHRGGAIRNSDGGTVNVINSTISGNSATSGGGAIYNADAMTITNSTISGNTAVDSSGGAISNGGTVTVTGSTISGNLAERGGGIFSSDTVTIISSTISGNSATNDGGGIDNNGNANVTLSIVAGNMAGTGADVFGSLDTDTFNLIGGDPMLGALQDNGGPTETHALLPGSPAIDAGDIAASPGVGDVPLFDQRGDNYGRVQNGRIDIGAFEVRDTLSADLDSDGFITGFDFLLWQRGFGTIAPDAIKTDGDGDNDLDTDGNDLSIWETQFGQPAPAVAATFLPVVETSLETEPSTTFQVEVTAALTSIPEEPSTSRLALQRLRLPANFIVRPNDPGLGFRFTVPRQVLVKARAFIKHIDEAFHSVWHSWPQQNRDLISDEYVRAKHGHSAKATRPADEAFAELADDVVFAGLRPSL